jgi:elongation factor Ts
MAVSPQDVQNLRKMTDAGFIDCKKALEECNGDLENACDFLRKAGLAKANKKLDRNAGEGRVFSYVHSNQKIVVMVSAFF